MRSEEKKLPFSTLGRFKGHSPEFIPFPVAESVFAKPDLNQTENVAPHLPETFFCSKVTAWQDSANLADPPAHKILSENEFRTKKKGFERKKGGFERKKRGFERKKGVLNENHARGFERKKTG